jgi:hypothetical protein
MLLLAAADRPKEVWHWAKSVRARPALQMGASHFHFPLAESTTVRTPHLIFTPFEHQRDFGVGARPNNQNIASKQPVVFNQNRPSNATHANYLHFLIYDNCS